MKTPVMHPSAGYGANTAGSERLMEAVRNYIATFCTPAIELKNVIPADTNFRTLPAGCNDYAIYALTDQENVGTPIEQSGAGDTVKVGVYVRCRVQVDVYSDAGPGYDNARTRAQTLSTLARTPTGVGFFDRYGIDCLFCDFAQNNSAITDANVHASRWTLTLNLGFWQWITVNQDHFTGVSGISARGSASSTGGNPGGGIANVDVAFHP